MAHVEFFYDLSSPWTRLAFANIQPILAETGATITWRPFLVGGVFNAANPGIYERRADGGSPAQKHAWRWLSEWARLAGTAMDFPSVHHPLRSVAAMRFCCALEQDQADLARFSDAAFDAYFGEQRNLDDPAELIAVANACGLDGVALAALAATQPVKDRLRANTDEAIARGAYGSPTVFVEGDHMYFGNDQLPLVRQRLLGPR
ncbi:2-hydroxychromene-2-carboxylate isomerase [Novosphingobium sp. Chol11]|uniref:2-hydroxychromene-2-carboxylate isomerase n=1 Tax=Novosphingobium sp. Chol11 TaxID=1385763 RepID=UPI0025F09635|nr:2-hydroxychromene-2-carboxylate isomerase [Novosphingobium sp. Chol11]